MSYKNNVHINICLRRHKSALEAFAQPTRKLGVRRMWWGHHHAPAAFFSLEVCGTQVLLRVSEQRNVLHEIRKRKANCIGHILRRNCLLKEVIEGKRQGQIEMTRRRGRRRKKLLDDFGDRRGYSHLKEEALSGGIILEEAVDLTSGRLLMMMMMWYISPSRGILLRTFQPLTSHSNGHAILVARSLYKLPETLENAEWWIGLGQIRSKSPSHAVECLCCTVRYVTWCELSVSR
jgi:hypothetical protein